MSEQLYELAKEYASLCKEHTHLSELADQATEAAWNASHLVSMAKIRYDAEARRILDGALA